MITLHFQIMKERIKYLNVWIHCKYFGIAMWSCAEAGAWKFLNQWYLNPASNSQILAQSQSRHQIWGTEQLYEDRAMSMLARADIALMRQAFSVSRHYCAGALAWNSADGCNWSQPQKSFHDEQASPVSRYYCAEQRPMRGIPLTVVTG